MIHFKLASVAGLKFDGDVYEILVPTQAGTIAIYQDHMPLISAGAPGVISIRKNQSDHDDSLEHFAVSGGVVQVDGKTVSYLSDDVTASTDVSEAEAEAAVNRAQAMMTGAQTQKDMDEARRMLHHSSAQLQVARIKKRHHN